MTMLVSRTIVTTLLIAVCLTIKGCERRTDTVETKEQNVQESSRGIWGRHTQFGAEISKMSRELRGKMSRELRAS